MSLLREFSAFNTEVSSKTPKIQVNNNQSADYTLWIKATDADAKYTYFITDLAEKRGLKVREFKNYLIIYST